MSKHAFFIFRTTVVLVLRAKIRLAGTLRTDQRMRYIMSSPFQDITPGNSPKDCSVNKKAVLSKDDTQLEGKENLKEELVEELSQVLILTQ